MDLQVILLNAIRKYGKFDEFPIPDIQWSERNMISMFGEYQYWVNKIIISRVLNTDKVSEAALESVVYHEYSHQRYSSEEENEKYLISKIHNYLLLQKELEDYFANFSDWTDAKANDLPLSEDNETLFCKIHIEKNNPESYLENMCMFDHYNIGLLDANIPDLFNNKTFSQVIFIVEANRKLYIVGWAVNVTVFSKDCLIDLSDYKTLCLEPFVYQFRCLTDNARWVFATDAIEIANKKDMGKAYKENGYCLLSDFPRESRQTIVEVINSFDYNFATIGLLNSCIEYHSSILLKDDKLIRNAACQEQSLFRKLWLMNKAISINSSAENYSKRADLFRNLTLFDLAARDYSMSISMEQNIALKNDYSKCVEQLLKAHSVFGSE